MVIYDGRSIKATKIGTYCGKKNDLEIWSTTNYLTISFTTKSGRQSDSNISYRRDKHITMAGFRAIYRISDSIVSLDLSSKNSIHVLGSECDERVISHKESSGIIRSPNWPGAAPPNITCAYTIDGLQDLQNLEKVKLNITDMNIPKYGNDCDGGSLKVYLTGQKEFLADNSDSTLCGKEVRSFTSTGPRMTLIFDTHGHTSYKRRKYGFEASYRFVTDYAIPGTPISKSACHFRYKSSSARVGWFNSPRYPSRYPPNTNCTYELHGRSDEWIRLSFKKFDLDKKPNCTGDVLYSHEYDSNGKESLIGLYCGKLPPGPLQSDKSRVKFVFRSGPESKGSGFKIKYEFFRRVRPTSDSDICGASNLGRDYKGGVIVSSNFGLKYKTNRTCDWVISVKSWARVLIHFSQFDLEGHLEKQGCANAVLKIYTARTALPTHELCGPELRNRTFISDENYMKIRFVTVDKAIGGKGFKLSWAAVRKQGRCDQFICRKSGFCIDNLLRCDGISHCGLGDDSDETSECPEYGQDSLLTIIIGVIITLIVFVIVIVCIVHRKRRNGNHRSSKNRCKQLEVKYVTRTTNNDRLRDGRRELLEHTEKVSNV